MLAGGQVGDRCAIVRSANERDRLHVDTAPVFGANPAVRSARERGFTQPGRPRVAPGVPVKVKLQLSLSIDNPLDIDVKNAAVELEAEQYIPLPLEDLYLETSSHEKIVRVAEAVCWKVRSHSCLNGVPYATNASKLSRRGVPSVVLGPGNIDQAHTAVEFVDIEQVAQAAEIYLGIMLGFDDL